MKMDYADAINHLNDEISSALARGETAGLSNKEMADELRRIALELEEAPEGDLTDEPV